MARTIVFLHGAWVHRCLLGAHAALAVIAGREDRAVPPVIHRRYLKAYAKVAEHIASWLEAQGLGPGEAA